jgi:hypothetical protein
MRTVAGDVVLSAASLAYLGAFTIGYRATITNYIKGELAKIPFLPISDGASLIETLGTPLTIR